MKEWEKLEAEISRLFPGVKATSASGRIWGDGDRIGLGISFEAKDHKQAKLDEWWGQTRRQALRLGMEPVLVVKRPAAKLMLGKAIEPEILAVCKLSYLAGLVQRVKELEEGKQ